MSCVLESLEIGYVRHKTINIKPFQWVGEICRSGSIHLRVNRFSTWNYHVHVLRHHPGKMISRNESKLSLNLVQCLTLPFWTLFDWLNEWFTIFGFPVLYGKKSIIVSSSIWDVKRVTAIIATVYFDWLFSMRSYVTFLLIAI